MPSPLLANLEKLIGTPRDGALLRFSIGGEYLKAGEPLPAVMHLRHAVELDPRYSAAWKLLGRALGEAGELEQALAAYREGIVVAEQRGDKQAAKEMRIFSRRIEKQLAPGGAS